MTARYTIGEIGQRFGLAAHVLRHWEDVGLLAAARGSDGNRRYTDDDMARVAMIQLGKGAGMTLPQLREVLATTGDRQARHDLLRRHRDILTERLDRARAALDLVDHALGCDAEDQVPGLPAQAHLAPG